MGLGRLLKSEKNRSSSSIPRFSKFDTKLRNIGRGISGYVDLYESKATKFKYVVKTYHSKEKYETKDEYQRRILHEFYILQKVDNINFIKVYKFDISLSGLKIRMFMDAGSASLYQLLEAMPKNKLDNHEMLCFWKQLCNGIRYLHALNICHRDLKLDNLVLDASTGYLKIIDLATASEITADKKAIGLVGSDAYVSPETIEKLEYDGKKADIWSIGIIVYYLLNLRFPWKSARLSDRRFVAFASKPSTDSTVEAHEPISKSICSDSQDEEGIQSVLRFLPQQSFKLMSQIFELDSSKRCDIIVFYTDEWFSSIPCCDKAHRCGIDHTIVVNNYTHKN